MALPTPVPQTALFSSAKCKSILCLVLSFHKPEIWLYKRIFKTFPEASQLSSLLPSPTDIFWLFWGFWIFLLIKKCPNLHVCVLALTTWPFTVQLHHVQAAVPLLCISGVLLYKRDPQVILGQSPKVIVSDGRGFMKAEGEDHQKLGLV